VLVRASSIMPVKAWAERAVSVAISPSSASLWTPEQIRLLAIGATVHLQWIEGAWYDVVTLPRLLSEGRLPEVSRWKDTAGPERVSAYAPVSFPQRSPSVVQDHQRALPMLRGACHG
jgi:hypothetical protein